MNKSALFFWSGILLFVLGAGLFVFILWNDSKLIEVSYKYSIAMVLSFIVSAYLLIKSEVISDERRLNKNGRKEFS